MKLRVVVDRHKWSERVYSNVINYRTRGPFMVLEQIGRSIYLSSSNTTTIEIEEVE